PARSSASAARSTRISSQRWSSLRFPMNPTYWQARLPLWKRRARLAPLSYAERMQRALALPTVAVALLLLTSCTPSPAAETPTASPSATADAPIFASEEEAVAAADEVIQRYWATANEVFQAGGEGVEKFESVVTSRRLASEESLAE